MSFSLRLTAEVPALVGRLLLPANSSTFLNYQDQMQKTMPKNSLKKSTVSYCKRNNIDEKQLIKAMNWYLSAKRGGKDYSNIDSFLKS